VKSLIADDATLYRFKKENFKQLKKNDIYAQILFILYTLGDLPEYETLSNIIMMTEYNTFLKLCECFGGKTITMPTIKDLNRALDVVSLYNKIDIDGVDYNDAINELKVGPQEVIDYNKLVVLLEKYGITTEQ